MKAVARRRILLYGGLATAGVVAPLALPAIVTQLAFLWLMILFALTWDIMGGQMGYNSFGNIVFFGIGAYVCAVIQRDAGMNYYGALAAGVAAGAVIGTVAAAVLGSGMLGLRGHYFAIGTWVVAEVFRLLASQISVLGGGSGISLPAAAVIAMAPSRQIREFEIYWLALALTAAVLGAIVALLRSRHGLALTAIRDNELAAQSNGIDVARIKLIVYVLTGFGTAMIGALIFLMKLRISPDTAFSVNDWTAFVIFITVIGGIGRIEGPIIGTIVFFALRQTLADLGSLYLLMMGAVAIVVMLWAPKGLWGLIAERFGWQALPLQRRLVLENESGGHP
ncbi:MAG TPA: branched-chain amino acid ABC transporter permease [Casimicrobiaceae bacterium]